MYCITAFLVISAMSFTQTGEWKLVWSDDFDYTGLPDKSKWDYEEGFIRNNEMQYYTRERKENARVENGTLIIEGRKEPSDYAGGRYVYWIGLVDGLPYSLIMTIQEYVDEERPQLKQEHWVKLQKRGKCDIGS